MVDRTFVLGAGAQKAGTSWWNALIHEHPLVHRVGGQPKELHFYAVYAERRYLAPKIRVFVDALLAYMAPEPPWDAFLNPPGKTRTERSPAATAEDATTPPGYAQKSRPDSRVRRR